MKVQENDIGSFLHAPNTYFKIPDFQRSYSWRKDNLESFWIDFQDALSQDKTHYFGSVFFQQVDGNERVIIDGQQRITTILIMMTVIYHLVSKDPKLTADAYPADRIKKDFLENEYGQEKNRVKLKGMTDDDKIFKQIYAQNPDEKNKKSNLYNAYQFFEEKLADESDLQKYIDGLSKLKIVTIELFEDDDFQKIFESINSTGVDLDEGDKIRNFALMLNNDSIRQVVTRDYWAKVEIELVDIKQDRNDIADFFRQSLIIHSRQEVKKERVYASFKELFKDKEVDLNDIDHVRQFYGQILDDLGRYVALKYNKIDEHYQGFNNEIFRMHYLGIEIAYPFLMSCLGMYKEGNLSAQQVREVFKVTESYLARRILVGFRTTGLNKIYHTIHWDIVGHQERTPDSDYVEIYKHILMSKRGSHIFPRNQYVERYLADTSIGKRYRVFILSSWDDHIQPKESFLLREISSGQSSYSIEHVMPQKLNDDWVRDLGPDWENVHEKYLESLANLTLTGYNSEYSNKSFSEKMNHEHGFANSSLRVNDFIKRQDRWDKEALNGRLDWWLDVTDKIWPFPSSEFNPPQKQFPITTLADATGDLTGSKPMSIDLPGFGLIEASHWYGLLDDFLDAAYQLDDEVGEKILNDSATAKFVSRHSGDFGHPIEIDETGYFVNTTTNTNTKIDFMRRVVELIGVDVSQVVMEIRYPDT